MGDTGLVRRLERVGDLLRHGHGLVERDRAARDARREVLAVHQLHHQRELAAPFFESMDDGDVGMIERGQRSGFALEPFQALGVLSEHIRQDLDRDLTAEPGVARAIELVPSRLRRRDR